MTVYQLLCCLKSPNWYSYQNPLSGQFDYFQEKFVVDLPTTAVDSYVGRLLSVALIINDVSKLDRYNFRTWLRAVDILCSTPLFIHHKAPATLVDKIQRFLDWDLPSEWLASMLRVYSVELNTKSGSEVRLNDPIYYQTLVSLSSIKYTPLVIWFAKNQNIMSEQTLYEEAETCP